MFYIWYGCRLGLEIWIDWRFSWVELEILLGGRFGCIKNWLGLIFD